MSPTWLPSSMSGRGTGYLWYPPLATDLTSIITDLLPADAIIRKTWPNNLMGDIYYRNWQVQGDTIETSTLSSDGTIYGDKHKMSGNILELYGDWYDSVVANYNDNTVPNYNAKKDEWTNYAEYKTPDPSFFDWFFSGWTGQVKDLN